MNFDLTDEQKMIRDMARDFADEVIRPRAEEMDESGAYPYDILHKMGELGMMGVPFPEVWGGSGGDSVGFHLCLEEISEGMSRSVLLEVTTAVVGEELFRFGTEEQKKQWLTPLAQGRIIGAFALTEPDSGFGCRSAATTAVRDGNQWVLNGSKQFITNIGLQHSTFALVAAQTRFGQWRPEGDFHLHRPQGRARVYPGQRYRKMGWQASATHGSFLKIVVFGRQPAGRPEQRLCPASGRPPDLPHRHGRRVRRRGPGLPGRSPVLFPGAPSVRPTDLSSSRPFSSSWPIWPWPSNSAATSI